MALRWLRESVRWKPWRWVTEPGLEALCAAAGLAGARMTRAWRAARRIPPPPAVIPRTVRRVIVLRPDRLGDLVLTTPMLTALRACLPHARIIVVVAERYRAVIDGHPAVDDVVTVRSDGLCDFWRARSHLAALQTGEETCIIVNEISWPVSLLAWWLGGAYRIGYDSQGMGFLFTHALPYPYRRVKSHQVGVDLGLLKPLGCEPDLSTARLSVPVPPAARDRAAAWMRSRGLAPGRATVMIHPGSRSRYTQWAPERFGRVADWVQRETPHQLIVLCGPGERPTVDRMIARMASPPLVAKGLALPDLIGLISQCRYFVGNSTGTAHVAAAVGSIVVMVIGGTHPLDCPERWRPWGPEHAIVHRRPIDVLGRDDTWLGWEGLAHITPEHVIQVLRGRLDAAA
jgi:ADP-heptose:LPS heptosyltransferase